MVGGIGILFYLGFITVLGLGFTCIVFNFVFVFFWCWLDLLVIRIVFV